MNPVIAMRPRARSLDARSLDAGSTKQELQARNNFLTQRVQEQAATVNGLFQENQQLVNERQWLINEQAGAGQHIAMLSHTVWVHQNREIALNNALHQSNTDLHALKRQVRRLIHQKGIKSRRVLEVSGALIVTGLALIAASGIISKVFKK